MSTTELQQQFPKDQRGVGYWLTILLAGAIALLGIWLFFGGAWLIWLGGSWYYAIAGFGLLVTAGLLAGGSMRAIWVYMITYAFTLVWAIWEAGLDGWAQVPRLIGPTLLLFMVLATIPVLNKQKFLYRLPKWAAGQSIAIVLGLLAVHGFDGAHLSAMAQERSTEQRLPNVEAPLSELEKSDLAQGEVNGASAITNNRASTPAASKEPEKTLEVGSDWPAYGGTYFARRFSPLTNITPNNVSRLERVWEYQTGDMPSEKAKGKYSPENTPLKVGDDLYICSPMGIAISVDAATGREEWRYYPEVSEDAIPYGATCRGMAYYEVPNVAREELCATRIIWGTLDARLIAVDAQLGQPCPEFGESGEVNLERGIGDTVPGWYSVTAAPTIVRGVVVIGAQVKDGQAEDSPSGVVRGYDAVTGEFRWAWDLGNRGYTSEPREGEVYTRGTPNMWTTAAGDEELGLVYLPLGNSAVDYYGSNRSEAENEYATSLVAVDVTTGVDVWHFQTVHNDVWDYDLGSQPSLVDFPIGESTKPALILPSKQGDIYVLDRRTGEPLFPVEEREVPTDMGVEPDYLADTQPFSSYHSLMFPALEEKDMWGMTLLDQLWCRIQFRQANYQGPYTPPTTDGHWIQYPGYNGGSDWGSVAVDTDRGILIANYNNMPNYNRLIPRSEAEERNIHAMFEPEYGPESGEGGAQLGSPYAIDVNAGWRMDWTGLMCKQPPYGGIRAIDLATGETLWDVPLGLATENGPFRIPSMLPFKIGTPNNGGPLVTAGGLIFIAAATDNLIRAIDIETGETLWRAKLPGGGQTTPISYEVGGRQFVAIAPGGHHFMETPISDAVIAWALPVD